MKPVVTTKLIAHRGFSVAECENTAAAFIAAGNQPFWGIETDLHRTADGQFVLLHDDTTQRIAHKNLHVQDATLSELQALWLKDLPPNGNPRSYLRIPTLQEYLNLCKKYRKTAVIEVKITLDDQTATALLDEILDANMENHVIFISFGWENLTLLRKMNANIPLQFLTLDDSDRILSRLKTYKMDLDLYFPALTEERVWQLHEQGMLVNTWTVDDVSEAKQLASWQVDFITTNRIVTL